MIDNQKAVRCQSYFFAVIVKTKKNLKTMYL